MGSSSTKRILSLLVVGAYVFSLLAGASSALQQDTQTTTLAEQTSGDNLKVYGPQQWNYDSNATEPNIEWHDPARGGDVQSNLGHEDSPYFDTVHLEPAYHQVADENVNTLTTHAFSYHPTFWMPQDEAVQPGSDSGLFEANDNDAFDPRFIYDEDADPDIDSDNTDNVIDLVTQNDNIPDFWSRNNNTGINDDIYFPAIVQEYKLRQYTSGDSVDQWEDEEDIGFPMAGQGGQAGINSYSPIDSDDDVHFDAVDSANDFVRIETDIVDIEQGETIQFWDFQATLKSTDEADAGDTATLDVEWVGDYNDPDEVQNNVVLEEGDIGTAERTDVDTTTPGTACDSGSKPSTPDDDKVWYICADTVNVNDDLVSVEVGRLFADREAGGNGQSDSADSILVNGAFYSVSELAFDGGDLDTLEIEQVTPAGDNVEIKSLGVTLQGTDAGDDLPVLPPFDRSHDVVEDFGVEADTNQWDFYTEDGTPDIELENSDIDDRLAERSARSLTWHAKAQETGLLADRQNPDVGATDWTTEFHNTYPNHYVEVSTGSTAIVESGLVGEVAGIDTFLWEPDSPQPIHFGSSVRLYSDNLDDDGIQDRLIFNPAVIEDSRASAGGDPADPLVNLEVSHEAHHVFQDEDGDGVTDLAGLLDEDVNEGMDSDDQDDTVDQDGDNLFDAETSNTDDDRGDQYAPAIVQEHRYRWLDRGDQDPTGAPEGTVDMNEGDSNSDTFVPLASNEDGQGLTSFDADGDGSDDETTVEFYDATGEYLRVETAGTLPVETGESAQFLDHKVTVRTTDADQDTIKLRIHQMDSGGGDEIISSETLALGAGEDFFGVQYDYSDLSSSDSGTAPQGTIAGTTDDPEWEFYIHVASIASNSADIELGRFIPADASTNGGVDDESCPCEFVVDQNLYRLASVSEDGSEIDSFTLVQTTPVDTDVTVGSDDIPLTDVATGDTVPLVAPWSSDHTVVDANGAPLEENVNGFFSRTVNSDGDDTKDSVGERLIDVGSLDLTVSATDKKDQSFIWHRSELDAASQQQVNGIHDGSADGGDGVVPGGGPGTGGFPAPEADFGDRPEDHEGNALTNGDTSDLVNGDRGYNHYVALDVPSGHGDTILQSERLTDDIDSGNDPDDNIVEFLGDAGTAGDPGVTASSEDIGWFLFDGTSDILDLFLGDGTIPPGQEKSPQQKAEEGIVGETAVFTFSNLNCSPSTVTEGSVVTCEVTATNDGDASGSTDVVLKTGGTTVDSLNTGSVDAGSSTTVALSWTASGSGSTTLTVADLSATVTVEEDTGPGDGGTPNIGVTSCSISVSEVELGGSVSASATFENTGDAAGSQTFNVKVDGSNVASVNSGTVQPGSTKTVSAQATLDSSNVDIEEPGAGEENSQDVSISVGGANCGTVTVTVTGPDRPTVPGFETAALIAAAGAALVLLRRD